MSENNRPQNVNSNGLALPSLVLGIIGIATSFPPITWFTIPISILAVIFGWIALANSTTAKSMAIWGLVLGAVTIFL